MRIAIVGLGPGANEAPFMDPDWQCWGMLWDPENLHRFDAIFQLHEMAQVEATGGFESAAEVSPDVPIYWQFPGAQCGEAAFLQYPLGDVVDCIGRDWFESSLAYMVGMALLREPSHIGLWGVHMGDTKEYAHQRPNLCWLLGLAEARGTEIVLPEGCQLLRYTGTDYPARYGYL